MCGPKQDHLDIDEDSHWAKSRPRQYTKLSAGHRLALGLLAAFMFTVAGGLAVSIYDNLKLHYERSRR